MIYSSLSGQSIEELEAQYADKGYGDFKGDLAEEVKKFLVDFQEKFNYYYENKEVLDEILDKGRDKASFVANKTLKKMENAIGLGRKIIIKRDGRDHLFLC